MTNANTRKTVLIPRALKGKLTKAAKERLEKTLTPLLKDPVLNFWEIVAVIGWGTKTTDYEGVSSVLTSICDARTQKVLSTTCSRFAKAATTLLLKKDPKNLIFNRGDDGTNDCVTHIIGLGEKTYLKFMVDPAAFTGSGKNCVENFGYCFHVSEDVNTGTPESPIKAILAKLTAKEIKLLRKHKNEI